MSIHPTYAQEILSGRKQVELRRTRLRRPVSHVVIYETAPIQRITGFFEVEAVEEDSPAAVWRRHSRGAGLDRSAFDAYFAGCVRAVAFRVRKATRLAEPISLETLEPGLRPPQAPRYGPASWLAKLAPPPC